MKNKLKSIKEIIKTNKNRNYLIIFVMAFTLIITGVVFSFSKSYAADEVYTKTQLREVIAATALSYLYNHEYTDYGQTGMTESPKGTAEDGTETSFVSTYLWRNLNYSPEETSRSQYFYIDCSSFSSIVYMNALGYDFSDYYKNANTYKSSTLVSNEYFKNGTYWKSNASAEKFKHSYTNYGKGHSTRSFLAIASENGGSTSTGTPYVNDTSTNTSPTVFYYKVTGSETTTQKKNLKSKFKSVLRKGDIIIYQNRKSDGSLTGHAMIYAGNAIDSSKGIIHSRGTDFKMDDSGNVTSVGDDPFSVSYNGLTRIDENVFPELVNSNATKTTTQFGVLRPINLFCNGTSDTCTINLSDNAKARTILNNLRTEQYVRLEKSYNDNITETTVTTKKSAKDLSNFNSVNKGDELKYYLYLKNESEYGICSTDDSAHYTKTKCTDAKGTWSYGDRASKEYNNLTITAQIPENTEYVEGSCTNCEYDTKTQTLTWNVASIGVGEETTLNYSVKVLDSAKTVKQEGMKISIVAPKINDSTTDEKYTLTMGEIETKVNPTMNGINIPLLRETIDSFASAVLNNKIKYSTSMTNKYNKTYEEINNASTATGLAGSEFVKSIYYNEFGIDLGYLTNANMKAALFNSLSTITSERRNKTYEVTNFYTKKTDEEVAALTNENYQKINKMLVKGMYGGLKLHGNDNEDRLGYIKATNLEPGDIIVTWSTNTGSISVYLFAGFKDGNTLIYRFTSDGLVKYHSNTEITGYDVVKQLQGKSLFAVLRPTQLHGTTVKFDYNNATTYGPESYVARLKYRHIDKNIPAKSATKVTYNYTDSGKTATSQTSTNKFEGWYTDETYQNKVTSSSSLAATTTHTLYAKWNTTSQTLPNPTANGYYLKGWSEEKNGTTIVGEGGDEYIPTKPTTLYAVWKKLPTATITATATKTNISLSISSTADGYEVYKDDKKVSTITEKTTNIEHNFATNPTTKIYVKPYLEINGEKIYGTTSNVKTINLEIPNYTVTYKTTTGGTLSKTTEEVEEDENPTGVTATAKEGYTFIKWIANQDVTLKDGTTVTANEEITEAQIKEIVVTSNITLTANFEINEYEITYKSDGHCSLSPAGETVTYNENPAGGIITTNTGYDFKHWVANVDVELTDGTTITAGNAITNEKLQTIKVKTNILFTAVTEIKEYTVTYKSDGNSSISPANETATYKENPTGAVVTVNEGYNFIKWTANKDVELTDGTTITKGEAISKEQLTKVIVESNLTFTAITEIKEYKVKYESGTNGTISGETEETISHGEKPTGVEIEANEGYKFAGWQANKNINYTENVYGDSEGDSAESDSSVVKTIAAGTTMTDAILKKVVVTEDITFTAVYKYNEYHIYLNNVEATTSGTKEIYEKYGEGLYLNSNDPTTLMSTTTSPITPPEKKYVITYKNTDIPEDVYELTFDGYYSAADGDGDLLIEVDGHITEDFSNDKYSEDSTIYANWIDNNDPIILPIPEREGSEFQGWYLEEELETEIGVGGEEYYPEENITLYAKWITTTQEVEVEVENGTVDSNKKTVNYNTNIAFTITAKEGYTSPTVSCTNEQTATIEEDSLIVNNVVEDTKCTVKYSDVDKPEIEVATTNNMDKKQTATITLKDNIGVKSYYIGTEKPNEQTTYEEIEETKEKKIEKEITTAGTYYVVAKDKTGNISEEKEITYYQIKFEPTNAEVSVNEVIVSKEITLPTATTTEEYSIGKSWYKDANCTIKAGEYGTKYTPTTNETLYTKAEKKTYKVTYKTDGNGTISGTTEETVDHGKKATGTTQTANEGYNFISWTADKEVTLSSGEKIAKGNAITEEQLKEIVVKEEINFTANYKIKTYTVTYKEGEKGTISGTTSEKIDHGKNPTGTKVTVNEGYNLTNWTANKEVELSSGEKIATGEKITEEEVRKIKVTSDITLTANYAKNTYKVTYKTDANGTISGTTEETVEYGTNPTGTKVTANEGYETEYWTADKDVTLKSGATIKTGENITDEQLKEVVINESITFTKTTKIKSYTVTYKEGEKGTISGIKEEKVNHNSNPQSTIVTANEGYNFINWTADKDVTLTDGTTITAGNSITIEQVTKIKVTSAITLTANYQIKTYKVTYKTDEFGTLTGQQEESIKHGSKPTGTEVTVQENYKLLKWIADKEVELEDGTKKATGEKITEEEVRKIKVTSDITLTAIHYKNKFKVTYKTTNEEVTLSKEEEIVAENTSPEEVTAKKGYIITEWIADKALELMDGTKVEAGEKITNSNLTKIKVTEDLILTATVEKAIYKVTYESDKNGKITGITEEEKNYEDLTTGTKVETNKGYRFTNWIADKEVELTTGKKIEKGKEITEEEITKIKVTSDITLTAIHEQIIYKVTYNSTGTNIKLENTTEDLLYGTNPTGAAFGGSDKAIENLKWKANKDVILTDGTKIKAGEILTTAQLKQVIIDDDIEFSIVTEEEQTITNVPNTGKGVGIIKLLLGAIAIITGTSLMYKATRKTVA